MPRLGPDTPISPDDYVAHPYLAYYAPPAGGFALLQPGGVYWIKAKGLIDGKEYCSVREAPGIWTLAAHFVPCNRVALLWACVAAEQCKGYTAFPGATGRRHDKMWWDWVQAADWHEKEEGRLPRPLSPKAGGKVI